MVSNEWYLKRDRLIEVWTHTGDGTVSLEAARLARDLFQYDVAYESAADFFTVASRIDDPQLNAKVARGLLAEEEEARIAAGVLTSPKTKELDRFWADMRAEAEVENAIRDARPDPSDNL